MKKNSPNTNPYLSTFIITRKTVSRHLLLVTGAFLTFFFGFGFVMCLTDASLAADGGFAITIVFLALGIFLLYKGIRTRYWIDSAQTYSTVFIYDENGVVTIDELKAKTGRDEQKILKDLEYLFSHKYFKSCQFQRKSPSCVIVADAQDRQEQIQYAAVTCPHCYASNRIRIGKNGGSGVCAYCGSALSVAAGTGSNKQE